MDYCVSVRVTFDLASECRRMAKIKKHNIKADMHCSGVEYQYRSLAFVRVLPPLLRVLLLSKVRTRLCQVKNREKLTDLKATMRKAPQEILQGKITPTAVKLSGLWKPSEASRVQYLFGFKVPPFYLEL